MNYIQRGTYSHSRFDNNPEDENDDIGAESRLSSNSSSLTTDSIDLALALGQDEEWHQKLNNITKLVSPQHINQGLDRTNSCNSSASGSNPVTPDDREPILMKRSTSVSYRRHRTSINQLYPSTSTQTTKNSDASRYLPQNQAVITTLDNWRISLANHIGLAVFSGAAENTEINGKHMLDFINVSHRPLLLDRIVKQREECHHCNNTNGTVLICGDILPIVKLDGTKSSATLWLKEKRNENGTSIFIWIFEEVFQSTIQVVLDDQQNIISMDEEIFELFGYTATDLIQKPITTLLPHFDFTNPFFGARTSQNASFPVMVKQVVEKNRLRILSMPILAGLVTVRLNGTVSSCNTAFSKYLFGVGQTVDQPIANYLPQFNKLITCLKRDELLKHGYILNNTICRNVLEQRFTSKHRDGTLFDIELQIKWLEETNEYALWITFDRDAVLIRHGHTTSYKQNQYQPNENSSIIRSKSINIPTSKKKLSSLSPAMRMTTIDKKPTVATAKITSFSRPTFTSTKSAIETTKQHMMTWPPADTGEYSAQSHKTNIDHYEILDELGQGAYGLVKLACLKNDPEKKRVVIKYVIKSRILVDCWTRDRNLGLIPAEIHVLHTLRKISHINCSDMLDYFEDDDYYYIVMDLFGAGMDLFDYIEFKPNMKEDEIRAIFKQIVAAVGHLHDHRIVHRDIKDENVILDLKGGVRLIDFGSAAYVKEGRKFETFVGTLDFASPEILKGQAYTGPPQDVWACGTLLYTLIYRENPFYDIDEIMEHELRIPFVLSPESVDLITKMLDRNLETRLNIHQVLEHSWLKS